MTTKKLLFIRHRTPDGIEEGGERLTNVNLSYIREILGADKIEEYSIRDKSKKNRLLTYISGCYGFFKNFHYGLTPRKVDDILKKANCFEMVYIDRSIFGVIAKLLRKNGFKGKIISFFHNVEYQYYKDRITPLHPLKTIIKKSVKNNEFFAANYSDTIIALNERDNRLLQSLYGRKADFLIPISLKNNYEPSVEIMQKSFDKPLRCLFLGTNFSANTEGLLWFVREVLPHVNIRLQIVGKGLEKIKSQLPNDNKIELYGSVPDLKEFLENANIMISPIFKGSGMKVKTCEAMMYGKHIIGSTETFEGYNVDFNKIGALANTKEEFIEAIKKYSSGNCLKYNAYSRDFFLENHSEEVTIKKFERILLQNF